MKKNLVKTVINIGISISTFILFILFMISFFTEIYITGLLLGLPFILIGGILITIKIKFILKGQKV